MPCAWANSKLEITWHLKTLKLISLLVLVFYALIPHKNVLAQNSQNPIYIVQSGDTINSIAIRFGVSENDILALNGIADPNLISIGSQLVIPGLDGISGVLTTESVNLGDSLDVLSHKYKISTSDLIKLNRITSPSEIFVGANLILPRPSEGNSTFPISTYYSGSNTLEAGVKHASNPWFYSLQNETSSSWASVPGDVFSLEINQAANSTTSTISPQLISVDISTLPLLQGTTASINVVAAQPLTLSGSLGSRELHFFPNGNLNYVALHGVYRMLTPGIYPFSLNGVAEDGSTFTFEQSLLVAPMVAIYDYSLSVDPVTIDPANTKPEDDLVKSIITPASANKFWNDVFSPPIDIPSGYSIFPDCTTSRFGNLRSYNDGPYTYFHTGLDLSACSNANLNIYAAAPGTVVFADLLTVRGNYVVIDHGWGVYSAYGHMSRMDVEVGQQVETGQLLGLIGATGRVAGPHLHWEVWVNGAQVEPLDWLDIQYP